MKTYQYVNYLWDDAHAASWMHVVDLFGRTKECSGVVDEKMRRAELRL